MTIRCKITRHCEIFVRKSKQSILATYESPENFLLYANLRLDLSIHFYNIMRIYPLKPRVLDCFGLFTKSIAMTQILLSTPLTKDSK